MKKSQHDLSKLKHQLFQMRNAGKKNPIWKLGEEEVEYLVRVGFAVLPKIYRINTRTFENVKNMNGLLKDVHYSKVKSKKNVIFKKLNSRQVQMLKEYGVKVVPYKYEIQLRN